jgi:hypothetical protein
MDYTETECIACTYYNITDFYYNVCLACTDKILNNRTNTITQSNITLFEICKKIINNTCDKCHHTKPLLFRIPLCSDHSPKIPDDDIDEDSDDEMYSID